MEAFIGLVTAFDIKVDVLVPLALIALASISEDFVAIALAINGTLNPVVGALVHNAGSMQVITYSALLLKGKGNDCKIKADGINEAY